MDWKLNIYTVIFHLKSSFGRKFQLSRLNSLGKSSKEHEFAFIFTWYSMLHPGVSLVAWSAKPNWGASAAGQQKCSSTFFKKWSFCCCWNAKSFTLPLDYFSRFLYFVYFVSFWKVNLSTEEDWICSCPDPWKRLSYFRIWKISRKWSFSIEIWRFI